MKACVPKVHESFKQEGFVCRKDSVSESAIPFYQTLKLFCKRPDITFGGIIGINQKKRSFCCLKYNKIEKGEIYFMCGQLVWLPLCHQSTHCTLNFCPVIQ